MKAGTWYYDCCRRHDCLNVSQPEKYEFCRKCFLKICLIKILVYRVCALRVLKLRGNWGRVAGWTEIIAQKRRSRLSQCCVTYNLASNHSLATQSSSSTTEQSAPVITVRGAEVNLPCVERLHTDTVAEIKNSIYPKTHKNPFSEIIAKKWIYNTGNLNSARCEGCFSNFLESSDKHMRSFLKGKISNVGCYFTTRSKQTDSLQVFQAQNQAEIMDKALRLALFSQMLWT